MSLVDPRGREECGGGGWPPCFRSRAGSNRRKAVAPQQAGSNHGPRSPGAPGQAACCPPAGPPHPSRILCPFLRLATTCPGTHLTPQSSIDARQSVLVLIHEASSRCSPSLGQGPGLPALQRAQSPVSGRGSPAQPKFSLRLKPNSTTSFRADFGALMVVLDRNRCTGGKPACNACLRTGECSTWSWLVVNWAGAGQRWPDGRPASRAELRPRGRDRGTIGARRGVLDEH